MLTTTELMKNLGKTFLTNPTLTCYEHRKIGRCHLHSNVNGTIQTFGITYNSETKLDVLYILFNHNLNENSDKITN